MAKNPIQRNHLPPPLRNLTIKELFLLTGTSLYLLEGFMQGKFKPRTEDREKLSDISRRFYAWNELEKRAFIQRKKYREVRAFISWAEKDDLLNNPEKYDQKLNALISKYWDYIIVAVKEKKQ